tara:strand:- start:168 stop:995 length:828 start_codon:yes stop_codon:yes gene_type:complete
MKSFKNIKSKGLILFDVSLRDGIQSIKQRYSLSDKKNIFYKIYNKYNPESIEIGSLVSEKIIPQMSGSLDLFKSVHTTCDKDIYMMIPDVKRYQDLKGKGIQNISLITSISNSFTLKNTNKSEEKSLENIKKIIDISRKDNIIKKIKLYISCINECPIDGKINNDVVIEKILRYLKFSEINEFCLSDTCGTLNFKDYKYILDNISKNINNDKIGLHLHIGDNIDECKKIINYSIINNVKRFDVSCLENTGGCVVTINENKIKSNLTYEQLECLLE